MRHFRIVIERHDDGYVAYPIGLGGIVIGDGDTIDEAVADVRSAVQFHLETFGEPAESDEPIQR